VSLFVDAWTLLAVIAAIVVLVALGPSVVLRRFSWRALIADWRARRRRSRPSA
jgi:hypothetical protein